MQRKTELCHPSVLNGSEVAFMLASGLHFGGIFLTWGNLTLKFMKKEILEEMTKLIKLEGDKQIQYKYTAIEYKLLFVMMKNKNFGKENASQIPLFSHFTEKRV